MAAALSACDESDVGLSLPGRLSWIDGDVMAKKTAKKSESATVGLEAKLWAAADALRNNMDAAEYKHVLLGLIFLKSTSVTR